MQGFLNELPRFFAPIKNAKTPRVPTPTSTGANNASASEKDLCISFPKIDVFIGHANRVEKKNRDCKRKVSVVYGQTVLIFGKCSTYNSFPNRAIRNPTTGLSSSSPVTFPKHRTSFTAHAWTVP